MRLGLVGLVKGMRIGKLLLMMSKFCLLIRSQNRNLPRGVVNNHLLIPRGAFKIEIRMLSWKIVVIFEFGQVISLSELPAQAMVPSNVAHVVGVYHAERCQSISHNSKKSHQNIINYVYDVVFLGSDAEPSYETLVCVCTVIRVYKCLPIRNSTQAAPNKVIRVA